MTEPTDDTYVSIDKLAQHLGITVRTCRQWVHKGFIPSDTYIHVAKTYRFNIPSVVEALKAGTPKIEPIELDDDDDDIEQFELHFD